MEVRRGIAVAPGVAIGPALVLGSEEFRIPHTLVRKDAVESEISRFHASLEAAVSEIKEHEQLADSRLGQQYGAIFAAHRQLFQDPKLIGEIEELIRQKSFAPEFAASRVLRKHAKTLQNLGDRYFAERAHDLFDLELDQFFDIGEARPFLRTHQRGGVAAFAGTAGTANAVNIVLGDMRQFIVDDVGQIVDIETAPAPSTS